MSRFGRSSSPSTSQAPERPPPFAYATDSATAAPLQRLAAALSDRYHFEYELGRGGAAYVFLARDRQTGRQIALKVLRPEVAVAVGEARFAREIEIARGLEHQNILPLSDFGSVDGQLFYTMPFIAGNTLRERLARDTQLALDVAIDITRDVARALDHAHSAGVIHRDIKPSNILLDVDR